MRTRRAENVGSGDQIVRDDGSWDRVHGVRVDSNVVYITSDSKRDARYRLGQQLKLT